MVLAGMYTLKEFIDNYNGFFIATSTSKNDNFFISSQNIDKFMDCADKYQIISLTLKTCREPDTNDPIAEYYSIKVNPISAES